MFQDFRYSDTEHLSRSDEVLKLKNFKKDATLKLFKSTNQERYEHVSPDKFTRWQSIQDDVKRLCLVDDLKMLKITYSLTSQAIRTSSSLKVYDHYINSQVKDYELKTKVKA
ncbi:hypothetical protein Tco_0787969 [Tanacetum coccineum]